MIFRPKVSYARRSHTSDGERCQSSNPGWRFFPFHLGFNKKANSLCRNTFEIGEREKRAGKSVNILTGDQQTENGSIPTKSLAELGGIFSLRWEPSAESVVSLQITDLPLISHGVLQHADKADGHGREWLILRFIELTRKIFSG